MCLFSSLPVLDDSEPEPEPIVSCSRVQVIEFASGSVLAEVYFVQWRQFLIPRVRKIFRVLDFDSVMFVQFKASVCPLKNILHPN